ncbi:hypothetical protein LIA77_06640 [Sarocladium implicatum]|nr:hypothetical protein LIA77_06640 [Sarocladium implicatum]
MDPQDPVWYFAYGSNMAPSVIARRGIKPLAARCAQIKTHVLVFDVFGVPYSEPAMAGIRLRPTGHIGPAVCGVAYLLSGLDYARLKKSEGAGTGYRDVILEAEIMDSGRSFDQSQDWESRPPIDAAAALAAANAPKDGSLRVVTLMARYPFEPPRLPSRRYMNLLIDGSLQSGLPQEYTAYLEKLPAYTRPKLSWLHEMLAIRVFLGFWMPILTFVMRHVKERAEMHPNAASATVNIMFRSMWLYHDAIHRNVWGCDGGGC